MQVLGDSAGIDFNDILSGYFLGKGTFDSDMSVLPFLTLSIEALLVLVSC